jgi:hypothetical protein
MDAVPPLDIALSKCSSRRMHEALSRLKLRLHFTDLPCCCNIRESGAGSTPGVYVWRGAEDSREEVAKGLKWLSEHVTPDGVTCVAVQSAYWLKVHYFREHINLTGKTDFVFVSDAVAAQLPASPTADELQRLLLPNVLGMYETKTSAFTRGETS